MAEGVGCADAFHGKDLTSMSFSNPPRPANRFIALDSLRGFAALAVVINHSLNLFPLFGGPGASVSPEEAAFLRSPLALLWDGRGAVAVFFVLSGFVLALPWIRGQPIGYAAFAVRRVCRIYLPYVVAIALTMALSTALAPLRPSNVSVWFDRGNWTDPVSGAAILSHLLMLGDYNTFDNAVWSLDHEMRISLVFPLLVWPIWRFGGWSAAVLAVGLYGGAGVITHFLGWRGVSGEVAATVRYAAFFVLGAGLACYADKLSALRVPFLAPVTLVAGLLLLWVTREPAVMAAGSALLILAILLPSGIRGALSRPWPVALGRISYSLYLIHLLVILSSVHLLYEILPLPVIAGGAFVVSLLAAWLFHRWVEAPSNRLGRRLTGA